MRQRKVDHIGVIDAVVLRYGDGDTRAQNEGRSGEGKEGDSL